MAANGVVFRQSAGYSASFRSEFEDPESRTSVRSVGMKQKKSSYGVLSCVFRDQGHLQYYSERSAKLVVCGKGENPGKKDAKMVKKKMKLVKELRRDLLAFSEMSFASGGLLNEVKANEISEAALHLLEQIQKIKSEEKELKRLIKEGKSSTSSSSSSSSESSDDSDCEEDVNTKTLYHHHPLAEEQQIPFPQQSITPNVPSLQATNDLSSSTNTSSVETVDTTNEATYARKIEVCIGGKCKKSGSTFLLDEFQRVLGDEGAFVLSGCKCLGKCKSGPVVKVSDDDDDNNNNKVPSNSLCVGVGLDDVSSIVANLLY